MELKRKKWESMDKEYRKEYPFEEELDLWGKEKFFESAGIKGGRAVNNFKRKPKAETKGCVKLCLPYARRSPFLRRSIFRREVSFPMRDGTKRIC